jgi:Helix-turn-helix domain
MNSQTQRILAYLKKGRAITPLQALAKFQCFRLGARIWDIRQMKECYGPPDVPRCPEFRIEKTMVKVTSGKYLASYRLTKL